MGRDRVGRGNAGSIFRKTMLALHSAQAIADAISASKCLEDLDITLASGSTELGFQYHALTHHPRLHTSAPLALRMHNYPKEWEERYEQRQLGLSDPVHRASHRVSHGFRWRDARAFVPIGVRDEEMLDEARQHDIDDGFTVPANIPGEPCGSVTFATRIGRVFPEANLVFAQYLGGLAYHQARVLAGLVPTPAKPIVTDRQIEVAKWVCLDKSDSEIAQILDVSPCTVTKHIRDMSARLHAHRRTSLALRVVWAGYLCFSDVIPQWYQF